MKAVLRAQKLGVGGQESRDAIHTARASSRHRRLVGRNRVYMGKASVEHSRASAGCPLPHPAPPPFSEYLVMPRLTSSLVCLENVSQLHMCVHFSTAFVISSSPRKTGHSPPPHYPQVFSKLCLQALISLPFLFSFPLLLFTALHIYLLSPARP